MRRRVCVCLSVGIEVTEDHGRGSRKTVRMNFRKTRLAGLTQRVYPVLHHERRCLLSFTLACDYKERKEAISHLSQVQVDHWMDQQLTFGVF